MMKLTVAFLNFANALKSYAVVRVNVLNKLLVSYIFDSEPSYTTGFELFR
jgi:hypothetical protein